MADLSELQSSQSVKVAGSSPAGGIEDNWMGVDSAGKISVKVNDGLGNSIDSTFINGKQRLDVNLAASGTDGGAVPFATIQVGGTDGTNLQAIATDTSGNVKVVGNVASGTTDSGNPVKIGGVYNTTIPAFTNGQRGDLQIAPSGALIITSVDGYKTTYSAACNFIAGATPTDIFTITGSATKTIRISRIEISATETTAASPNLFILKRSTANSGGTSTTVTNVPLDSAGAAATAVVRCYTANPTLGTLVGNIRIIKFIIATTVTPGQAVTQNAHVEYFGNNNTQALVLRGTSEVVAINLNSITQTGNNFCISIEWSEE